MAFNANFLWEALKRLGYLAAVLQKQATADANADGVIDGNEQLAAGLKMLPDLGALAGTKIQGNDALDTPEEQEQFITELDALLRKYKILGG